MEGRRRRREREEKRLGAPSGLGAGLRDTGGKDGGRGGMKSHTLETGGVPTSVCGP